MKGELIAEVEGIVRNGRVEIPWKLAKELLGPNAPHDLHFVVEYNGKQSGRSAVLHVSKPETIKIELEINPETVSAYDDKYKNYDYFYDIWSNVHFGYVGISAGFTSDELLDGAGWAQLLHDAFRPGARLTVHDRTAASARMWDDISDQRTIELGTQLFIHTRGDPTALTPQMILDGLERLGTAGLLEDSRVKHICFDDSGFTIS